MRLLQFFFSVLWIIGYVGNGILFLYIEWSYLRQGWVQIFNPFLHVQVLLALLSTTLFWILFAMAIVGYYLTTAIEQKIDRKEKASNTELDKNLSIPPPISTNTRSQLSSSFPKHEEKNRHPDRKSIKQQADLLEWAIQSSQKVQFDYEDRYKSKSQLIVIPVQFQTLGETLCLEAYCPLRKSKGVYSVERIRNISLVSTSEASYNTLPSSEKLKPKSSDNTSRTLERTYFSNSTKELEEAANANWSSVDVLKEIYDELGFRSRRKAHRLREKIYKRLTQFESTQFIWPTTTAKIGSQSLPVDTFKYQEGLLRHYGYKVGIHGLNQSERLKILDSIFLRPLMPMNNYEYLNEWGEPKTARRLKKLAESIAAFTRNAKRHNDKKFGKAIQDWESDLAYLKTTYYVNRFSFRWPNT